MILRFVIIISFILSVGAALGSFSIFSSYQTERQLRLDAESKMLQVQDTVSSSSQDAEQQLARISELEADVERLKTEQTALKSEAEAKSGLVEELEAELTAKKSEIESLNQKLKSMKPAVVPVSQPVTSPTIPSAVNSTTSVSATIPVVPNKVEPAEAPVAPAPKVSSPSSVTLVKEAPTSSAPVSSSAPESEAAGDNRILTVNRKFNFIVVNLGLKDGLRMGDKVEVVQGSSQKALAQVEKIYDKFSAATLLSEDKGNPVHEGDTVRKL